MRENAATRVIIIGSPSAAENIWIILKTNIWANIVVMSVLIQINPPNMYSLTFKRLSEILKHNVVGIIFALLKDYVGEVEVCIIM